MKLTQVSDKSAQNQVDEDPEILKDILCKGATSLLHRDYETSKAHINHYVVATVGYEALSRELGISLRSVKRLFKPEVNYQVNKMVQVLIYLQKKGGFRFEVG